MNKVSKGYRSEVKAQKFYEDHGFIVQRTHRSKYNDNDFFGLFDLIALHKVEKPTFVQVKSNIVTKEVIRTIAEFARDWNANYEIIVIRDRKEPVRYVFISNKLAFKIDCNNEHVEDLYIDEKTE